MKHKQFFSSTDLAIRWGVKRQTVNSRRIRHPDFPEPTFRIGRNRAPMYDLKAVEKYEKGRGYGPEKGEKSHGE